MEQERLARESEEKERAERMNKIKEQFTDGSSQWEKDKTDIQNLALEEKAKDLTGTGEEAKAPGPEDPIREAAPAVKEKAKGKVEVSRKFD